MHQKPPVKHAGKARGYAAGRVVPGAPGLVPSISPRALSRTRRKNCLDQRARSPELSGLPEARCHRGKSFQK